MYSNNVQDAWVELVQLNRLFWGLAEKLNELPQPNSTYGIDDLISRLDRHAKAAREASRSSPHVMLVVITSYEVLAVFIVFFWAHRLACEKNLFFLSYSAALDPKALHHLSLDDIQAIRAADCARGFLERHGGSKAAPFRDWKDTLSLALDYGRSSSFLKSIYVTELKMVEKKIGERYRNIQETKQALAELDPNLTAS